jgi:hypothetical protein
MEGVVEDKTARNARQSAEIQLIFRPTFLCNLYLGLAEMPLLLLMTVASRWFPYFPSASLSLALSLSPHQKPSTPSNPLSSLLLPLFFSPQSERFYIAERVFSPTAAINCSSPFLLTAIKTFIGIYHSRVPQCQYTRKIWRESPRAQDEIEMRRRKAAAPAA